jgi:dihydrofolate reductase
MRATMSKLRLNITMSVDGYVAGPNQSLDHPLGEGADTIHDWATNTKSFREMHGDGGGDTGINSDAVAAMLENVGATIMGRNMFGGGGGPWGKEPWNGWWGDTPPFHMPVFVLTHHEREPLALKGGTTFTFVTNGIDAALTKARDAAGTKDILIGGGASVANQYLAAGLIEEIDLHIAPIVLGDGARLFADLPEGVLGLEQLHAIEGPGVMHVRYRVKA